MSEGSAPAVGRRGPGRDLTQGPILTTLLAFALPTLASNVLQSFNGSINAVWVGRFLGEAALAATSNANLIMFLMFAAVFGFGMAATIMVGQSIGRGDVDAARRAHGSAIGLFLIISAVSGAVGWAASPALLRLLGTPTDVFPLALTYIRVMFLAFPPSALTVLLTMGLRGSGDSLTPMWFMIFSAAIDIVLNPVLILGLGPAPRLGIAGAATATLIANYATIIGLVIYIYARDLPLRLRGTELRYLLPEPALLKAILTKGIPMGLQMLVVSGSALAMMGLVNREGTETVAAYGAANQLWTYIQMPALAIGAAVSAMAAQNIGAGAWDRVGRVAKAGVLVNLTMTGVLIGLVMLVDRGALGLFLGSDQNAISIATRINLLASWNFLLFSVTMTLSAVMRGNGVAVAPLVILFVAMFPVRFGMAAALRPSLGPDVLWLSFPVGSAVSLLLTLAYYLHGGWRKVRVIAPVSEVECKEAPQAESEPAGRMQPAG